MPGLKQPVQQLEELEVLSCAEVLEKHSEYIDDCLTEAESGMVQAHLDTCPKCARYHRTLRKGVQYLSQQSDSVPGPDFLTRFTAASRSRKSSSCIAQSR